MGTNSHALHLHGVSMKLRPLFVSLLLSSVSSAALAQTSRAQMSITPTTVPEVLRVLDNTKTWVPIGTVNSSLHAFTPIGGGGGGGGVSFPTHAALLARVAPSQSVSQQGFYASGDGGAATYQWNAMSYCAGGTSGSPTPADGFVCILPSGQAANTPGRYLQRLTNGVLNLATLGFKDDGTDNSSLVAALNTVLSLYPGIGVNFPLNPAHIQSNYWFSQPLEITNSVSVSCGAGTRQMQFPPVNLVFGPGISGVRFENFSIPGLAGNGVNIGTLDGCGVASVGFGQGGAAVAGNTTVPNTRITTPSAIAYAAVNPEPMFSIGDGAAMFPGAIYWYFSGSITGNVLTVTTWNGGWSVADPGIAVGQMVQGSGVPAATFIQATHAENPTYTGTGTTGTYLLTQSIAAPFNVLQANSGALSGNFQTEVQTGPPLVPEGTTVVGCSSLSGTHCTSNGGTLTLSNAPRLGVGYYIWFLPGPNTSYAYGSQMYNISTSLTGQTNGPITGGISNGSGGSGNILNVTGGAGSLKSWTSGNRDRRFRFDDHHLCVNNWRICQHSGGVLHWNHRWNVCGWFRQRKRGLPARYDCQCLHRNEPFGQSSGGRSSSRSHICDKWFKCRYSPDVLLFPVSTLDWASCYGG